MFRSLLAAMAACALVPATSMAAIHTVAPGETLWGIAYANNLPTSAVAAANGLSPEARVVAGTNLTIPAPGQTPTPPVNAGAVLPGHRLGARGLRRRRLPRAAGRLAERHRGAPGRRR